MCVSPVSPNSPMTPGRFLAEHMQRQMVLARPATRRPVTLRPVKEARASGGRASPMRLRGQPSCAAENSKAEQDAVAVQTELSKAVEAVAQMQSKVSKLKDVVAWMDPKELLLAFNNATAVGATLRAAARAMNPQVAASAGEEHAAAFDEAAGGLHLRMAIMSLSGSIEAARRVLKAGEGEGAAVPFPKAERDGLKAVPRVAKAVLDAFGMAAMFAPVAALRTNADAKKAFGQVVVEKLGLRGQHKVAEEVLDVKLEEIFEEMDADGEGTICVDEMQAALEAMGVSVSKEEAHKMMAEVDEDGNG
ncbi:hypothetical protein T484DRAFT_1813906, partial [Baffinella frigidus]